jgi:hypothetical protein
MQWAFQMGRAGCSSLYEQSEVACDIGTFAHAMVEQHIKGLESDAVLDTAPQDLRDRICNAFGEYLEWEQQTRVKFIAQEIPLVSELYRFGGCPDAIGIINDKRCLIDWKTSNGVYPDHLIQLAAYQNLWNENFPDQQLDDVSYLCRFSKEFADFEVRKFGDHTTAWELFKLYRQAYELDKQLKKRVR